jgi:hypothetical protein
MMVSLGWRKGDAAKIFDSSTFPSWLKECYFALSPQIDSFRQAVEAAKEMDLRIF